MHCGQSSEIWSGVTISLPHPVLIKSVYSEIKDFFDHHNNWNFIVWGLDFLSGQSVINEENWQKIRAKITLPVSSFSFFALCNIWPHIGELFSLEILSQSDNGIWIYTINIQICHIQFCAVSPRPLSIFQFWWIFIILPAKAIKINDFQKKKWSSMVFG